MNYYEVKKTQKMAEFNKIFPLADYFIPLIGNKNEVTIADLGSGPVSTTGSYYKDVKVTLYPSDKKRYGWDVLIPIEFQNMEHLTYPSEFFDIVHCVNALDHTRNPYIAISEMKRVCRPGGWIYLRHASSQKDLFGGHHYHNIEDLWLGGFITEYDFVTKHKWITHTRYRYP